MYVLQLQKTVCCLMPKDQGKNNKQNFQLNIQMFVCYEAKQPHILESGVAWRWVDKTSG